MGKLKSTKGRKKIGNLVDEETGEIIDELYDGDRVKHQQEEYKEDETMHKGFTRKMQFVKILNWSGMKMVKNLTPKESWVVLGITDFICYDDCILRTNGRRNGRILTTKELSEIFDTPYETFRKIIASLIKKGIISSCDYPCKDKPKECFKCLIVNPYVFMRGENLNYTTEGIFENSQWKPEN